MLSYFLTFITQITFILGGFTSKNYDSKNDINVSVECKNESGEMYESCEEESFDGSSELSDSCEEETFDEAYASLLDENLKKKHLCNQNKMTINYDIQIINGNVNIGPSASETTHLKTA